MLCYCCITIFTSEKLSTRCQYTRTCKTLYLFFKPILHLHLIQGFNRHTAISRAIYFCLFSSLLLSINQFSYIPWQFSLFGVKFSNIIIGEILYKILSIILLCLPLLFLFGLLPQCSTFILCLLENFDMHLFGGTAMINIPGALYSFSLSIINWILLSIIGYYGLIIHTSKVGLWIFEENNN